MGASAKGDAAAVELLVGAHGAGAAAGTGGDGGDGGGGGEAEGRGRGPSAAGERLQHRSAESVLAAAERERRDSEYSEYSECTETDQSEASKHDVESVVDRARKVAAGKAGATLEL